MNQYYFKTLIFSLFLVPSALFSQFEPGVMESLSKLPVQERNRLIKKYGVGQKDNAIEDKTVPSSISNSNLDNSLNLENEKKENQLGDLLKLEQMLVADIVRLEVEVADESIDQVNLEDAKNALQKTKEILRSLKSLQLEIIERKAESIRNSEKNLNIKPFGYDLFTVTRNQSSNFDAPIPAEYRMGSGDLIEVQLFGQRNESYSLEISREGIIQFPEIGPINAFENGTSFIDLKNLLKQKVTENFGDGVQSSITLGAFRSINIFLLGEVEKQGVLTVNSMSSVVDALLDSRGIKETGSMRNIQLNRAGKTIANIDLYDLLLFGDKSSDHLLNPGDVIFIPVIKQQVTVEGAVRRPAKYELLGDENLSDIIKLSGGLDPRAFASLIKLERLDKNFYPIMRSLNLLQDGEFKIINGDMLKVNFATSNIRNVVSVVGDIEKAGNYEWKKDLELKDLISNRLDFSTNADLEYGIIARKSGNGKIFCISFIPSEIFEGESIPLFPEDKIYFFSKSSRSRILESLNKTLRSQTRAGEYAKLVRVNGSVHFPGEYPLTESMSLQDLLRASGGTMDSSYIIDAEITRMVVDPEQVASLKHIRIDQKSLFDKNSSTSFRLLPYDVLSVKPIPLWREGETIELIGEFKFPGIYSIKSGETIVDVIERAGGLTERAFPQGAIFSRQNLRIKEEEQKVRLITQLESDLATATLSATDPKDAAQAKSAANAMISRLKNTESQGRLAIKLEELLTKNSKHDLLIKNGDILTVPQVPYAVSVSGEVLFPSSHMHYKDLKLNDYLRLSGGFTQNADEDRTFVVKANGSVMSRGGNAWFDRGGSVQKIEVGDVIVVPIDLKQTRFLENLTYGTQIIYQLAVAAAAVNSF